MLIIKYISTFLGRLLSYILPMQLPVLWRAICSHFYTGFVSRHFKSFGKGTLIGAPVESIKGAKYISVGENTVISRGALLTAWPGKLTSNPKLVIGNRCQIGIRVHISAALDIEIGDNLLTGPNVLIVDNSHGELKREMLNVHPSFRPLVSKGPVIIGNNVWIGANACIMPGVTIGDGAIIGANSVVTKSIPPFCVAVGTPANVVKKVE